MLSPDSGRQLRKREGPPSPRKTCEKMSWPLAGAEDPRASPVPDVLRERSPPQGTANVDWGGASDDTTGSTSPRRVPFKRSNVDVIPNLAAGKPHKEKPAAATPRARVLR